MSESTSQASFSLAGFQVTLIGRFWVTPEAQDECSREKKDLTRSESPMA
jgi:hypothetical protein